MSLTDKISGRLKQAAGDLTGSEGLRRQGRQEERKADAKQELAAKEAELKATEARADVRRDSAERRAAEAARKEFAKAERDIQREEREVEAERAEAERRRAEVQDLEHRTDPSALQDDRTKDELYEEAQRLDIEGRSEMTKDELAAAITAAK